MNSDTGKLEHSRPIRHWAKTLALVAITCAVAGGRWGTPISACAEEANVPKSSFQQFLERDYLLGDWWGLRPKLATNGVDFEFMYFGSQAMNLSGGIQTGSVYEGAFLMTLDLGSEKLVGYEGGHLHAGGLQIHGSSFSEAYVGDLNKTSLLDFAHGFRLWELWYEQKLLDGKISLKAGQLAIDRDFIVPEYYASFGQFTFVNQTFFFPTLAFNVYGQGFPEGRHGLASTPYGAPGVRLRVDPTEKFYVQAGVYDGNPDDSYTGTRVNLNSEEGALAFFELGYRLNQQKTAAGAPGSYKLGGFYHTDSFYDAYQSTWWAFQNKAPIPSVFPATRDGNFGLYFLADQMLLREVGKEDPAQQGLIGFFRATGAPGDRNLTQFGLDGGLVYRGLIPTRDWDTLGLGLSYLQMSDAIRRAQQDINQQYGAGTVPVADYEGVLELNYRIQVTAWWVLQLSGQRVFHPGGRLSVELPDAWVCILGTTLRF